MEFRKLMAFGNSSFIISVPKAWVEKNRLKKGDVLLIEQKPNELILSIKEDSERRRISEATVNPENKTLEELKTEITSLYVNNCDVITVVNVKDGYATKELFRELVGMEIVEETATKIVAKDLLDIQEVSLDNIIRRIDIIIRSMLLDALEEPRKHADSISGRDREINRLSLLGFRTSKAATDNPRLLKLFNTNYWDVLIAKQTITHLEHLGDQVKRIARAIKDDKLSEEALSNVQDLLKQIHTNYMTVMKIHYEKNKQKAFKAETEVRAIIASAERMLKKDPSVPMIKIVQQVQLSVGAMKGVLRSVMEHE